MATQRKPIFTNSIFGSVSILLLGIFLYYNSLKSKTEYETVKGKIDYIDKSFENLHPIDHRFIHVEGSLQMFDVFIGKQTGDFSPKFEKLDELNVDDDIVVYHSETTPFQKNNDVRLNKNVEFIDKNAEPYFIRGNKNRIGGLLFIGTGIFLIIGLVVLRTLKKIY